MELNKTLNETIVLNYNIYNNTNSVFANIGNNNIITGNMRNNNSSYGISLGGDSNNNIMNRTMCNNDRHIYINSTKKTITCICGTGLTINYTPNYHIIWI